MMPRLKLRMGDLGPITFPIVRCRACNTYQIAESAQLDGHDHCVDCQREPEDEPDSECECRGGCSRCLGVHGTVF